MLNLFLTYVDNLSTRFIFFRPKCSVSSVLKAPGPCGKIELRHKGDLDTTKIIKEEQRQTVDGREGSYSGHPLKTGPVSGSAPVIHREGDRRSYYTHSDRSKHRSLACKRTCRQNSSTSCTQNAEQALIYEPRMETAPSRGECLTSFPSRVTEVDLLDQIITQDMNSSTAHFHNMNAQNEVSSKSLSVLTNQQEESDEKQDSSEFEAVRDGNILPNKYSGNNLSEKREASPPTQSFSPVRKIQRKVRVYKRTRRKVDAHIEHLKPSDIPDNSILKLMEFFQSSEDMDVEFLGFEDQKRDK